MPRPEPPRSPSPGGPRDVGGKLRRRDQRWASHAYDVVGQIAGREAQNNYKIMIHQLGADILRNGLSVALATLERQKSGRGGLLLDHLARAGVTGLAGATQTDFAGRVRRLDVDAYMLATRELLELVAWLKRAAQAMFEDI
ncbi:MAG TPA: type III-B CRISPR module-associated protein Cmr5 [Kofleriaceae bacterium]|nr:type III-B CRISPR module-associated protein Cmr5 [Kofleriaceae bacterium]